MKELISGINATRLVFALVCGGVFYIINPIGARPIIAFLIGFGGGIAIILIELPLRKINIGALIAGAAGMIIGLAIAVLISHSFRFIIPQNFDIYLKLGFGLVLTYAGMIIFLREKDTPFISSLRQYSKTTKRNNRKILDTNVIIDGRIIGICNVGFLDGALVIPRFVLQELQRIADSDDPLRRKRGRMGLDILNKMEKGMDANIVISKQDFRDVKTVDEKLILLAKETGAKILTNDFSLCRVARLEGVDVLNINELASALKPVILAGEVMNVKITKEGKEPAQGVAYLDDGTMIVVEEGKAFIGKSADIVVISTLQTEAGRMIFARIRDHTASSPKKNQKTH
ncbi:MAG: putative PIN and TRAM-domain containing protein YacL [Syntrophomonadaceae bacterium]|nr:putative PIN and TRAM-domain containing protein YacL [Bacillota bacterium]